MSYKNNWFSRAHNLGLSNKAMLLFIVLALLSTATEIFGIGIFLPIFQFMRLEGDIDALVADSAFWKYLVDLFAYYDLKPSLPFLLIVSFLFFFSRQIFIYIRTIYKNAITERLVQNQRNCLFDKYIAADTAYHDSMPVGNLANVIIEETKSAVSTVIAPMGLIAYMIMLIGYLFLLFILSWQMTVASIVVISIVSMVPTIWIKKSLQTGRKLVNANILMSEFLISRLQSPRLVRLSGTETAEKKEFHALTFLQRKHKVSRAMLSAKTVVSMDPAIVGLSLLFLYVSYTILHLQIEVIGIYLVVALRLMPVVQSIIVQFQAIQGSLGSVEVLESRFNAMKKFEEKDTGIIKLKTLEKSILLSNVYYRYSTEPDNALKGITIEFKADEVTAIVGPSGGGKSTLIDLLPRLRLPTEGVIHVDGVDIKEFTLKSLRKMMSYVPQSPQIFNGTVKDHILYGRVSATDKEVLEASRLAGAEEFINKLPQGFDTILGEDAVKLSGGERQRLDLARALVRKAKILILDEPTSNLDAESEKKFKQVLFEINRKTNTAIIVVAHRLKSISDADNIIVLNKGLVEESGKHSELLSRNGWYSMAWNMQLSG